MSTTPRIIAATASAALLAATGAGAAVFAVETVTAADHTDAATADQASAGLKAPKDDRTTVYRSPGDGWSQQELQQAPNSTTWGNGSGQSQQPQQQAPNKAGKSHSS